MIRVKKDLTGKIFGRLKILCQVEDFIGLNGKHESQWLCECNCEDRNKVVVRGDCLKYGGTKSCGCLRREAVISKNKANKKQNIFDIKSYEYGIGYTSKGEEFYFDLEDYNKIKDYCWHIDSDGYVVAVNDSNKIMLHRLVINCPDGLISDHIHGETSRNDNRKSNLRIATRSQNAMNQKMHSNNTSGVTGVYWHKYNNKWIAQIKANGKTYQKYFNNFDDAVSQRKEWEEKYFGEFSYDNSIHS